MNSRNLPLSALAALPLEKLAWALVVAVLGFGVVHYLMKLVRRAASRAKVDQTLSQFLMASIRLLLCLVVVLMVTDALGIPVSSLIALLSVVGLAVSLAVQNLLVNMVSGLVLLISKPFTAGDFIESGTVSGVVHSVNLLHTRINTPSNKALFVPNARLTAAEITNHNLLATRRVELSFTAPLAITVDDARRIALGAASDMPGVLLDPAPTVHVNTIGFDRVEYLLRAWTQMEDYWTVYFALLEAIKRGFETLV